MLQPFNPHCEHYTQPGTYVVESVMKIMDEYIEWRLYCPIDKEMIGGYKLSIPQNLRSTERERIGGQNYDD